MNFPEMISYWKLKDMIGSDDRTLSILLNGDSDSVYHTTRHMYLYKGAVLAASVMYRCIERPLADLSNQEFIYADIFYAQTMIGQTEIVPAKMFIRNASLEDLEEWMI